MSFYSMLDKAKNEDAHRFINDDYLDIYDVVTRLISWRNNWYIHFWFVEKVMNGENKGWGCYNVSKEILIELCENLNTLMREDEDEKIEEFSARLKEILDQTDFENDKIIYHAG